MSFYPHIFQQENQQQNSLIHQLYRMLKLYNNRPTTAALTPWATNDEEQLASLLPDITTKKKKKKIKKQNLENQDPSSAISNQTKNQSHSHNHIAFTNNQIFLSTPNHPIKPKPNIQEKQNEFNFIKKSKKLKSKTEQKNRQIICPQVLTSQREYVRSSNYITLQDQMSSKINPKNQSLFKDIMITHICKTEHKKLKDVHSLYLIGKLKGISSTQEPIKIKFSHQKSKILSQNPFLDYLSHNNGFRQHEKRVLTQRGPRQFTVKTQGYQNQVKNQLNFLKNTTKNSSYLTHRKKTIKNNQESAIIWSENQNFNIQSTFALKTSTVLKACEEFKSMEMKSTGNKSNLLKSGKINNQEICEENEMEGKFQGIELQNKPQKMVKSLPLHPINYELNQMQSVELPAMKEKVSFKIQKSQFSVKPSLISKEKLLQKYMGQDDNMSIKMGQEIKRNLRKLRGYLVKKTRDQCMEKGNLDENELLIYENNQNYFRTE